MFSKIFFSSVLTNWVAKQQCLISIHLLRKPSPVLHINKTGQWGTLFINNQTTSTPSSANILMHTYSNRI